MLTKIAIRGLFNNFDYDIELKKEGITILTGPNGYGKTTILRMIYSLASHDPLFFISLLFREIVFHFSNRNPITFRKRHEGDVDIVTGDKVETSINRKRLIDAVEEIIMKNPYRRKKGHLWYDSQTNTTFSTDTFIKEMMFPPPEYMVEYFTRKLPTTPDVYIIREQRLLRRISTRNQRSLRLPLSYPDDTQPDIFTETIKEYAKELSETIRDTLAKFSQIAQKLDSSFPRRLFDQQDGISETDFNKRFKEIRETQKALSHYGLSIQQEDNQTIYKLENAKALLVYLNDTEEKLKVFSALLEKLNAFTEILNERRFAFKNMLISEDRGISFTTDRGQPLALTDLSSGEQQEVVLFYELLFKVKPGTLVLINEPEISLHVAWQKEFLNDLLRVTRLQKINVIVATHSPQIISDHWDLTVDLEEISRPMEAISR